MGKRPSATRAARARVGAPAGPASRLQGFLDRAAAYASLPRRRHTPAFHLEPLPPPPHAQGTEWYYLRDGRERIGLVDTWKREIEMFRFLPAGDGGRLRYEIPEVYHWANMHGARIQLYGTQMLPPVASFAFTVVQGSGPSLTFRVEQLHEGGLAGASEYHLGWDDRLGYVWTCVSQYTMAQPREVEFNNLLARGVSDSRDDHKQWQKTVRALADGRVSFVHHNPLHLPTDDVHAQGFVGFVTEPEVNPFVELLETSEPVFMATCSQWYDQHILMRAPRTPQADGLYRSRAQYRFLSLPGALARELEATAVPGEAAAEQPDRTGFLQGKVNDFEVPVPRNRVYNGPVWSGVDASEGVAHSGRRSICLTGPGPGQQRSASPIGAGPGIYGESAKRYRLAAWVKTHGLHDGAAWLQVDDVRFSWQDVQATHRTEALSGDRDWTRLELDFAPAPHDPFLLIKLCVQGTGAAWFDDLELVELAR